jgi:DNA ligase-1
MDDDMDGAGVGNKKSARTARVVKMDDEDEEDEEEEDGGKGGKAAAATATTATTKQQSSDEDATKRAATNKPAAGAFGALFAKGKQQQQQQQQKAGTPSPSGKKASPAATKQQQKSVETGGAAAAAAADVDDNDDDGAAAAMVVKKEEESKQKKASPPPTKPAPTPTTTKPKKPSCGGGASTAAAANAAEGVGTGALEAAAAQAQIDVRALCAKYGLKSDAPCPYAALVDVFEDVASTTKRLEILSLATALFRAVLHARPQDLLPTVYLCTNRVAPPHEGAELGVGDAILTKALAQVTGRKDSAVKAEYEKAGDWGVVAVQSRATQGLMFKPAPLTVPGVFKALAEIARTSGASSQDRKKAAIARLLVAAKGAEAGYLLRTLAGRLRIGLAEKSVLTALAHATLLHKEGVGIEDEEEEEEMEEGSEDGGDGGAKKKKSAKPKRRRIDTAALADRLAAADAAVRRAYSRCPSLDVLIPALVDHPLTELDERAPFTPGVPVGPMLAKPTTGVREVLDKFSGRDFTCEYKYDGERVQIHVLDGGKRVRVFSRNSEDTTGKFPDIAARCGGWLAPGVSSVVVDGEAVAWDPVQKRILPFQQLSTRARKDVAAADVKVAVVVYAFDCLYLDGEVLLDQPLTARRDAMRRALSPKEGELTFAHATTSADVDELARFLDEAVAASTEGLIVKTLKDPYTPAQRASCWLKLKKDYLDGCGDTFDVVPVGAYSGKGKRAGVYGAYLLAVYDEDTEKYQTISKLGTGFSEETLAALDAELRPGALLERPACVEAPRWGGVVVEGAGGGSAGNNTAAQPDVWFVPSVVWEVKAADLSISPVHRAAAGLVHPDKGVSIRFPRLLRRRDDKAPLQATTAAQVAEMYRSQAVVQQQAAADAAAAAAAAAGGEE